MANTWIATDEHGATVAEFRSVDYDPHELVERHGAVTIYDRTDRGRFITAIRPEWRGHGELRRARAVTDER